MLKIHSNYKLQLTIDVHILQVWSDGKGDKAKLSVAFATRPHPKYCILSYAVYLLFIVLHERIQVDHKLMLAKTWTIIRLLLLVAYTAANFLCHHNIGKQMGY